MLQTTQLSQDSCEVRADSNIAGPSHSVLVESLRPLTYPHSGRPGADN